MQLASIVARNRTASEHGSSLIETIVALCIVCLGVEAFFRTLSANRILHSEFSARISMLRSARIEYLNRILPSLEPAPQSEIVRCTAQECRADELDLTLTAFPGGSYE